MGLSLLKTEPQPDRLPPLTRTEMDRYLATQKRKTVEQRLSDLEAWQLGATEMLGTLTDLHAVMQQATKLFKFWAPVIASAAITSGLVGGKGATFIAAILKGLGFSS